MIRPGETPAIWTIPYQRDAFFTGREEVLQSLYASLQGQGTAALMQPRAMSGLGGVGKTQTALEYAYRYCYEYQAVLWVRADSASSLAAEYLTIATLLQLPERDEEDQQVVLEAVKRWLRMHPSWLLILDNVEDMTTVNPFLPSAYEGHVLLTTRATALGVLAKRVEITGMHREEGALFLLRRAERLPLDGQLEDASLIERTGASAVAALLDGLPLALDQAGAYIRELGCSFAEYLDRYQEQRLSLLQQRGLLAIDHPESVVTTWSLSFDKIRQSNSAAAELLSLFAFLYSEEIPEEVLSEGASALGPVLGPVASERYKLNEALRELLKFSLLQRYPETKTCTVHRLVQAVLKDSMSAEAQQKWARCAIMAINETFPSAEIINWSQCQRCLPHVQTCAEHMNAYRLVLPEGAYLLSRAGRFLDEQGRYDTAEPLLEQSHQICETLFGPEHEETIRALHNLAALYHSQGRYELGVRLALQALTLQDQLEEPDQADTAITLTTLATLYDAQGRYRQAEQCAKRALSIREQVLGSEHLDTATSLNDLAAIYEDEGEYQEAEQYYKRALQIKEYVLGPNHPTVAQGLNNLASLYRLQGRYEEAQRLYLRALAIREEVLGPEHPGTTMTMNNLAVLYRNMGQQERAEWLYRRVLELREKVLGPRHPETATALNNIALLYREQEAYEQAEPLYLRALAIREKALGREHVLTAQSLNNLARLYRLQQRYDQAEQYYQQALKILEKVLGTEHPHVATVLNNLASLFYAQDHYEQAEPLYQRALTIYEKAFGSVHPDTVMVIENLAFMLPKMGREAEADILLARLSNDQDAHKETPE